MKTLCSFLGMCSLGLDRLNAKIIVRSFCTRMLAMFSSALVTTNTHGSLVFVVAAAADRKFKILFL